MVVEQSDGWFVSTDQGDSFRAFGIDGLPDQARPFEMEIVGSRLFMPMAKLSGGSALHVAPIPSGGFAPVTTFPQLDGARLSYGGGNLLARSGSQFVVSNDGGASFTILSIEAFAHVSAVAKYLDGQLYVLTDGTLYVAAAHSFQVAAP